MLKRREAASLGLIKVTKYFSNNLLIIISELVKKILLVGYFYYMKIQFGMNKTRLNQEKTRMV